MERLNEIHRYQPHPDAGLTEQQVQERIRSGLYNRQPDPITKTGWQILRDNLFTWFNLFNLCVGVAIAVVGAYENLLFLIVILANILIGIVQEFRSKRLIEQLSLVSAPKAKVIREGALCEIPQEKLVLDDVTLLLAGQQVCADAIVLSGEAEVNESLLTGESEPVPKHQGDVLLSGSFVVSGRCMARVEHVGEENYASGIAMAAKRFKKVHSDLMDSLDRIVKFTSIFILPLGALLFSNSCFILKESVAESVTATAAALLGMMPKGLVLLTTLSLVVGVIKLAREHTLVQELYSIETLSRVDVLCLDKTGTVTQGVMRVDHIIPFTDEAAIQRAGRAFVGALMESNSTFLALKDYFGAEDSPPCTALTPFSSERKWSSASFGPEGTILVGAPDILLKGRSLTLPEEVHAREKAGARVLLMAHSREEVRHTLPTSLTPLAVLVLLDPIRPEAREIFDFFYREGVDLKIISGDHPAAVGAIAAQAGLKNPAFVDAGMLQTDEALAEAMERYSVFGRVTPQQKQKMVKALQSQNHTVAMIGDGVNDVLALKEADCSIAMAAGSDAARQISQLVLLDNSFSTLPHVMMEGRRVINNITRTASLYLVKTVFSFLLSLMALLFAMPYPFIPVQMTLICSMTEGIPSFFLTFEPNASRVQKGFLTQVLTGALPTALTITLAIVIINLIAHGAGLTELDLSTLAVYLTSLIWLQLLFKICLPFTPMRLILWLTMTIGLFGSFLILPQLLPGILHIGHLSNATLPLFLLMGCAAVPAVWGIRMLMIRIPAIKSKLGSRAS